MTTYKDLNTILNWPDLFAPEHFFFFIRDSLTADGSFLLPHFLNSYLSSVNHQESAPKHVRFINLNQSFFHYSTIELKLNMNLQKEGQNGKLLFVDAQNGLVQSVLQPTINNNDSDNNNNSRHVHPLSYTSPIHVRSKFNASTVKEESHVPTGFIQWNYNSSYGSSSSSCTSSSSINNNDSTTLLDSLFQMITGNQQTTVELKGGDCKCIILDHVDVLALYTKNGFRDVFMFVQRLLSWAQTNSTAIVLLMHGDGEANLTANLIEQYANVVFRVGGLPTGYSKDVHGLVEVVYEKLAGSSSDANAHSMRLLTRQTLHYKCFEHNVTLFSPGSHSDII